MAEQQQGVWGIELGQCALKAIRMEVIDGQVTATAFDYVEHPKILSQPDADPDALTREALEKFLSRNSLRGDVVAIGVPGQSGLARFVKLPPVEEKKIPDIVRFEAKQQIPFPLDEVVWDFQKIGSGVVTDGFAMETEIGLFALKRDTVSRSLQHFTDVNVEVHIVQMAPLALCNYVAYDLLNQGAAPEPGEQPAGEEGGGEADDSDKKCIVALDIGTDNSNLVVTDGGRIIWQRPIPFGGNHFTRALTKDLKLTFAKAEHLKRNATKSPDLKKILAALKPVLNDFVGEVQRSLGYFTNTHRNAQVEYMIGLGNAFRLPGLQKFLSEKLQIDVRKLSKMERLTGDEVTNAPAFTQNIMTFATAYGLALQGLKLARLQTNLLPQEIRFERMVRAKKPWAVMAAAALLFGVMVTELSYSLQYRAVAAPAVEKELKEDKAVAETYQKKNSEFDAENKKVDDKLKEVSNVIAGQEDRLDWILLNQFVNECMPVTGLRLDGKYAGASGNEFRVTSRDGQSHSFNFTDTLLVLPDGQPAEWNKLKPGDEVAVLYNDLPRDQRKYWNDAARKAFLRQWLRQSAGKSGEAKADEGMEDLLQVNIESIVPIFGDLGGYWQKLSDDPNGKRNMNTVLEADRTNPPTGEGWVVELRGYTYHREPFPFLKETILANLASRARTSGQAAKEADKSPAKSGDPKLLGKVTQSEKDAKWEQKIDNKISHVILYDYKQDRVDDAADFKIIGGAVVTSLVPEPAAGGAGGGQTAQQGGGGGGMQQAPSGGAAMGGGGGSGGKGGSNWTPLTSLGSGSARQGGGGGGGGGGAGMPGGGGGMPGGAGGGMPGGGNAGNAGNTQRTTKKGSGPQRTEFIILFVWRPSAPANQAKK